MDNSIERELTTALGSRNRTSVLKRLQAGLNAVEAQIVLLGLVSAIAVALLQPVWSRVDEAFHYDVVDQYAHGVAARSDATAIRTETRSVMDRTGVYRYGAFLEPQPYLDWTPRPLGLTRATSEVWWERHMWQYSNEGGQAPLYYLATVPVWWFSYVIAGALGSVYALRIVNAFLVASLVLVTLRLARATGARGLAAPLAGFLVAMLPGLLVNGTTVTNDTLGDLLGAVAVLLGVLQLERTSSRRMALTGVVLGLGVITKLTVIGIAPAVALLPLLVPAASLRERARWLAALAGAGCVPVALWVASRPLLYGTWQMSARVSFTAEPQTDPSAWLTSVLQSFVTFLSGEARTTSWNRDLPILAIALLLIPLSLVGGLRWWRTAEPRTRRALAFCAAACVLQFGIAFPVAEMANGGWFPGRFLYAALAPAAVLFAGSIVAAARGPQIVYGVAAVFAATAILALVPVLLPGSERPIVFASQPSARAELLDLGGGGTYAGLDISVSRVLLDRDQHDVWLWVTVANNGSEPIEWSPEPALARAGTVLSGGYYPDSHPFAERMFPGQTDSGWVELRPSSVPTQATTLYFFNISPLDHYQDTKHLGIELMPQAQRVFFVLSPDDRSRLR